MLHVALVGPRPAGSLRWQGLHPKGAGSQGVQGMSTRLPQQGGTCVCSGLEAQEGLGITRKAAEPLF